MSSTFCSHNPTCPPQKPDTDAPKTWLHKLCDTNQINTSITGCTSHPSQGSHGDLGLSCPLQTRKDCRGSQAAEVQWGRCLLSLPPHHPPHPPPDPDRRRRGQRPRVTFCLCKSIRSSHCLPPLSTMLRNTSPEDLAQGIEHHGAQAEVQTFRPAVLWAPAPFPPC